MKVSQVAKAYVTWALVAYVAENLADVKALDQSADKKLSARARAIGFDTVRRTLRLNRYRAELQESEGMSFTTGFLYSDAQTLEYAPEKLLQHNMVVPVHRLTFKQTMLNDCLASPSRSTSSCAGRSSSRESRCRDSGNGHLI